MIPSLEEIIKQINQRPRSLELQKIADDCNVTLTWLSKVITKKIKNPGYEKMKKVYEYMISK